MVFIFQLNQAQVAEIGAHERANHLSQFNTQCGSRLNFNAKRRPSSRALPFYMTFLRRQGEIIHFFGIIFIGVTGDLQGKILGLCGYDSHPQQLGDNFHDLSPFPANPTSFVLLNLAKIPNSHFGDTGHHWLM